MMNNFLNRRHRKTFTQKVLVSGISAAITLIMTAGVSQASDIDLYQAAKSGDISLMLLLDLSGSMDSRSIADDYGLTNCTVRTDTAPGGYSRSYCSVSANSASNVVKNTATGCTLIGNNYSCYDRISRLKDGVFDLLNGNVSKRIDKLDDNKVIGLSGFSRAGDNRRGYIVVPARRLGCTTGITGCDGPAGKTQRALLLENVASLSAAGGTPTANAYADVAAYLMGGTTKNSSASNSKPYIIVESDNSTYGTCSIWNGNTCSSWLRYGGFSTNMIQGLVNSGKSSYSYGGRNYSGTLYSQIDANGSSGFDYADSSAISGNKYLQPKSLSQTEDIKKCSGQGIYVLTDGAPNGGGLASSLMKVSLNNNFSCTDSETGWDCIHKFSQRLLNSNQNPANLVMKTAVVGFGTTFNNVASYDKSKTQQENIDALGVLNTDTKNAAYWGIIGGGGWYSGSSSQDVVDSVNKFISSLATEIPPVTTGSPTIPNDALYPIQLQNYAYYPQFSPTPDKTYQLWSGNLKKYKISQSGYLVDKNESKIVDTNGKIVDNYDFWSTDIINSVPENADENTLGSKRRALMGGVKSQLLLQKAQNATVDSRKLLTNRIGTTGSSTFNSSTTLRQVSSKDISDAIYKNDPNRGYLISLLGYKGLDVTTPANITPTSLTNAPELRQIGAVMHSSPVLLTNAGKITVKNKVLTTDNRQDYVLFGSTQGLLHVVDAVTGKEKFAFVPNEMVENQKQAFLNYDVTSGGLNNMYYGIDGPWTAYTEYVVGNNQLLTVGSGLNSAKGTQMVYGGLRMGGRSYYALDLQDIDNPQLKFVIDPANKQVITASGSKTFDALQYMGQSWSKPQISWVRWNGQKKLVMFVGGGYDAGGEDGDARTAGVKGPYAGYESDDYNQVNAKGSGIYMFDALNGDLLWWTSSNASNTTSGVIGVNNSDMKYSVTSEIRTVDSDEDGLVDNLYFGDLGGQVWRVDLDNKATKPAEFSKKPVRLLNLNKGANSPRFYDTPAFSVYNYTGNKFAVISIGSGNRSKPLAEYTYGATSYDYDSIYNIYDKDVVRSDLLTTISYNTKDIVLSGLQEITALTKASTATSVAPYSTKGWYFKFKSNLVQSAKVMGTPVVMNYKMYVSYFDASKPGLSGDCGAGVKGESFLSTFCMPFGQCAGSSNNSNTNPDLNDISLGAGIQTPTIGDKCAPGQDCSSPPPPPECIGTDCKSDQSKQYCISSGGRILITPQGGKGGSSTQVCLTPLKWYEKIK